MSSGKISTTFERCLISLLIRSSGLVEAILGQCALGERGVRGDVGFGCWEGLGGLGELALE